MGCGDCKSVKVDVFLDIGVENMTNADFIRLLRSELKSAYYYTDVQVDVLLENAEPGTPCLIYTGDSELAIMNIHRFAINGIKTYAKNNTILK